MDPRRVFVPLALDRKPPARKALLALAARCLGRELKDGRPLDPLARFRLGDGVRVPVSGDIETLLR